MEGSAGMLAQATTDKQFVTFALSHWMAVAAVAVAAVLLAMAGRRLPAERRRRLGLAIVAALVLNELIYYAWTVGAYGWAAFAESYMPLHICGAAVYLLLVAAWRSNQIAYELAYFWGLAGTTQATITPNLQAAFPSYHFFQYFLTHGLIIVAAVYLTVAMRMRPARGAVLRTVILTNAYMAVVAGVNLLLRGGGLDANYMFLCRRPEGSSPMFFLPWPWYIVFLEGVAVLLVLALYLPWVLHDRRARHDGPVCGGV